jgi:hypothetical protein
LVWKCLLRCHIKLKLELRNSLLLALPNHCWIHRRYRILQFISNTSSTLTL